MFGCRDTSLNFGVRIHALQSSVGNVLSICAIRPPMEGDFSRSVTLKPWAAISRAACIPATPPPTTSASFDFIPESSEVLDIGCRSVVILDLTSKVSRIVRNRESRKSQGSHTFSRLLSKLEASLVGSHRDVDGHQIGTSIIPRLEIGIYRRFESDCVGEKPTHY